MKSGQGGRAGWQFVRFLAVVMTLLAVPLTLVVVGIDERLVREHAAMREIATLEINTRMTILHAAPAVRDVLDLFTHDLFLRLSDYRRDLEMWTAELQTTKAAMQGMLEFALFDGRGRLVASASDLPEYHTQLASFGVDLQNFVVRGDPSVNGRLDEYKVFLGPMALPFFGGASLPRQRLSSVVRERAYVNISSLRPGRPWAIVWISLPKAAREYVFDLACRFPLVVEGPRTVVDLDTPIATWGQAMGRLAGDVPMVVARLAQQDEPILAWKGHLWTRAWVSPRKMFLVAFPDHAEAVYQKRWQNSARWLLALVAAVVGVAYLLWTRFPAGQSLRVGLIALFFYSSAVPVLVLVLAARGWLVERQALQEESIFRRQGECLREYENRLIDFKTAIESRVLQIRDRRLKGRDVRPGDAIAIAREVARLGPPDLCAAFDERGHCLFQQANKGRTQFTAVMPFIGAEIGQRFAVLNHRPMSMQETTRYQTLKAAAESSGANLDEIAAMLQGARGAMTSGSFAGGQFNVMNLSLYDRRGKATFVVLAVWGDHLANRFGVEHAAAFSRRYPGVTMAWGVQKPQRLGRDAWLVDRFEEIRVRMLEGAPPITLRVSHGGRTVFVTGIGFCNTRYPMFAWSDDDDVRRENRAVAGRLTVLVLCLLALGCGVGAYLVNRLFPPIAALARGVAGLRRRDFSLSLPVTTDDELGRLTAAFNRLLAGMADLEVAREVQTTFFPAAVLADGDWEIYGTSQTASQVGGDYFDYIVLPDGRWLIVVGDVTGHGVPAALVVAMAKAMVFHPDRSARPAEILVMLNQLLLATMKKQRCMTCFIAVFDPRDGRFTMANAGHNYPYAIDTTGVRELKPPAAFPLGVRAKSTYEDLLFPLVDTRAVVFYTDGFIEALDRTGESIGYRALECDLPRLLGPTARTTEENLRRWFADRANPGPLADDSTIVVLQRRSLNALRA